MNYCYIEENFKGYKIDCGNFNIYLQFYPQKQIRIVIKKDEQIVKQDSFAIKNSLISHPVQVSHQDGKMIFKTEKYKFEVILRPFAIRLKDKNGREVFKSKDESVLLTTEKSEIVFFIKSKEGIYGLGQDPMGFLNQRNRERRMWNEWCMRRRGSNVGIPFLLSSMKYGLLLNTSYPSRFVIGKGEMDEPTLEFARDWAKPPWSYDEYIGGEENQYKIVVDQPYLDLILI